MRKYISFILLTLIFFACSKEDALEPSNFDKNWFERVDNPDSQVDHEIYEIYKNTKVAVLYNDTIGSQDRGYDSNGNKIIYYYTVDLNYSLYNSAKDSVFYTLVKNESEILSGLKFVQEEFLSKLSKEFYPNSILLANELYLQKDEWTRNDLDIFKGFNCLAIGNIPTIEGKTNEEKKNIAQSLISTTVAAKLPDLYKDEINKFYSLSFSKEWQIFYFGMEIKSYYNGTTPLGQLLPKKKPEEYGFIKYIDDWGDYYLASKSEDLISYVHAVITGNEEDFKAKYKNYAIVMAKYNLIKDIIAKSNIKK